MNTTADTRENWENAKTELKAYGISINTRIRSCETGCACVGDEWFDTKTDTPYIWQTGKRFSPKFGGYLNHKNLTDKDKLAIFRILTDNKVSFRWNGKSNNTILIELEAA